MSKFIIISDVSFPKSTGGVEKWLKYFAIEISLFGFEVYYLNNINYSGYVNNTNYIGFGEFNKLSNKFRNRSIWSSIKYSLKVFWWALKHTDPKDVIYLHQTPYFPLIVFFLFSKFRKNKIFVEWIEIWKYKTWLTQGGFVLGTLGFITQTICLRMHKNIVTVSKKIEEYFKLKNKFRVTKLDGLFFHSKSEFSFDSINQKKINGRFLIVSRLSKEKNVTLSVNVFLELLKFDSSLSLTIIGSGKEKNSIEKLIDDPTITNRIKILDKVEDSDLIHNYMSSEYLLHLSRREGFGLVVGEASTYGVVPILLENAENESVSRVDGFGIICKTPSAKVIAREIIEMMPDRNLHSLKAYEYYKKNLPDWNVKKSVSKFIDLNNLLW